MPKKLYTVTTTDRGDTETVRSGKRFVRHVLTAETHGGRSKIVVEMRTLPNGDVACTVRPETVCAGFHVGGRSEPRETTPEDPETLPEDPGEDYCDGPEIDDSHKPKVPKFIQRIFDQAAKR